MVVRPTQLSLTTEKNINNDSLYVDIYSTEEELAAIHSQQ